MSGILCINIACWITLNVFIANGETHLFYTPPKVNELLFQVQEIWEKQITNAISTKGQ